MTSTDVEHSGGEGEGDSGGEGGSSQQSDEGEEDAASMSWEASLGPELRSLRGLLEAAAGEAAPSKAWSALELRLEAFSKTVGRLTRMLGPAPPEAWLSVLEDILDLSAERIPRVSVRASVHVARSFQSHGGAPCGRLGCAIEALLEGAVGDGSPPGAGMG